MATAPKQRYLQTISTSHDRARSEAYAPSTHRHDMLA